MLKLGGSPHVKAGQVLAHRRRIRPVCDRLQAVQVQLISQEVERFGLGQPTDLAYEILSVDLLFLGVLQERDLRLEVVPLELFPGL